MPNGIALAADDTLYVADAGNHRVLGYPAVFGPPAVDQGAGELPVEEQPAEELPQEEQPAEELPPESDGAQEAYPAGDGDLEPEATP